MADEQLPQAGEVWNASASVRHGALLAAQKHSAARLSPRMKQELQLNSQAHGPERPCIVVKVTSQSTVQIFPITTLGGVPLDLVKNDHIKHFLVPFGDDYSQIQIKTTPTWPMSNITPSYVFGYPMEVPITAIHRHCIKAQTFDVDPDEFNELQRVAGERLMHYKAIPESTMQRYNASWAEDESHSYRRNLYRLTGRASAPPGPLSAARPVSATHFICPHPHPHTIWESPTAHPLPSIPSLDLGIDEEAANQWPALHSADPAASGHWQKAASDPGVQSGSAWVQPLMRPREEETACLSASSQTATIPPETVRYEEVVEATEEAPFIVVSHKKNSKRQSWGTGGAK